MHRDRVGAPKIFGRYACSFLALVSLLLVHVRHGLTGLRSPRPKEGGHAVPLSERLLLLLEFQPAAFSKQNSHLVSNGYPQL